jgi:hypothetical protein
MYFGGNMVASYASNRHADRISAILLQHRDADIGIPKIGENMDPDILARSCVVLLARKAELPEREALAVSLAADQRYYRYLIDARLLSPAECLTAAGTLCGVDTAFVPCLIRAADDAAEFDAVMRTLDIVERLDKSAVAAQWIRRQAGHADPTVRSKAVKILSRLHVNLLFIERQLTSRDPRVRANAVEGLWGVSSHGSRQLLEKAASDGHHRVAANGLVGLCLADAPGAIQKMIHAARAESPELRAATAWAMGQTGRKEFYEELDKLASDAEANVRDCAARAINRRKTAACTA